MFEIEPEADPLGQHLELVDIAVHTFLATGVELGDAVFLDVGLALEAKLLLDFDLDWQAVGVPAATCANDVPPAHALVAHNQVFGHTRFDVVNTGLAIRRWWPLEKDKWIGAVTTFQRTLDHVVLFPPLADLALHRRK